MYNCLNGSSGFDVIYYEEFNLDIQGRHLSRFFSFFTEHNLSASI